MTYTEQEKSRGAAWKASTPTLPTEAKAPAGYVRQDGTVSATQYDFCLPAEYATYSLLEEAREPALQLFAELPLDLRQQPDNVHDPRALFVTDADHALGWVPQPLLAAIGTCRQAGALPLGVLQSNGPGEGDHLRLLLRADGQLPIAASLDGLLLPAS